MLAGAPAAFASGSAASSSAGGAAPECDAELYADLLRRAGGDAQLVGLWLAEMGYKQAAPPGWRGLEKQPSGGGIKAVGGGLAAWASMPAARGGGSPSKDFLKATGGCCQVAAGGVPCAGAAAWTACHAAAPGRQHGPLRHWQLGWKLTGPPAVARPCPGCSVRPTAAAGP